MRLIIKQKIFSFGDNFVIRDEMDNPILTVKGKVFSFGDKLRIYDMYGNEIFYIEQKLFKLMPQYEIWQNGNQVAYLKREFTLFKPRINIQSVYGNFTIEGKILQHNFTIYRDNQEVAVVSKKFMSFSDTYTLDIRENENVHFLTTLVIVIDQMLHDDHHNNS